MKMQKRKFRIGELANRVGVERFVIRFWEKEFSIKTDRSNGKQRFYTEDDYTMFKRIKELLYNEGFTITGAKKHLSEKEKKASTDTRVTLAKKITIDQHKKEIHKLEQRKEELSIQIMNLQKKLMKLRELL